MSVSFEIYTLVNGRWQIHVRYDDAGREEAVREAEQLEREPHIERVRVVRDEYDSNMNTSRELVVYETKLGGDDEKKKQKAGKGQIGPSGGGGGKSGGGKAKGRKARQAAKEAKKQAREQKIESERTSAPRGGDDGPAQSGGEDDAPSSGGGAPARAAGRKRKSSDELTGGLIRIAVALLFATVISLIVTYLSLWGLKSLHQIGYGLGSSTSWALLVGIFLVTFALIFVPMVRKVNLGSGQARARVRAHAESAQMAAQLVQQVPQIVTGPQPAMPVIEAAPEPEPEPEPESEPTPAEPDQPPEPPRERTANAGQNVKDASGWLLSMLGAGTKSIPDVMKSLDAFNRFGLTLYFAGAGDFVGTRYRCNQNERSDMLTERIQLLGHDENTAFAFCANIDEYLMQPKYLKMYDLGRTAMKNYLSDQGADLKVPAAVEMWNKPAGSEEEEAASDFVVVLFTDIVDSTAQTQEIGDEGAMEVVRAHNQIIREALTMFHGTEVKHMGDGIMAVFNSVPNSVHAAIQMQEGIESYNTTTVDRQFDPRGERFLRNAGSTRSTGHVKGRRRRDNRLSDRPQHVWRQGSQIREFGPVRPEGIRRSHDDLPGGLERTGGRRRRVEAPIKLGRETRKST